MYRFFFLVLFGLLFASCQLEDFAEPGALVPPTVDQDASLPSLAINGTLLHVESYGNPADPLLIMIHGGPGGDYRSLLHAKVFGDHGFRVVFYDQRGSGLSKREDKGRYQGEGTIGLFLDDLDALIKHFRLRNDQKSFSGGALVGRYARCRLYQPASGNRQRSNTGGAWWTYMAANK